jgi:uncharacterized protein DUF4058
MAQQVRTRYPKCYTIERDQEPYFALVNRAFCGDMRRSEIWPVPLDEPLPLCPVPLLPPDVDVPLPLGEALAQVYRRAAYARRIDYALLVQPPPLRAAMQRWLAAHLAPLRST